MIDITSAPPETEAQHEQSAPEWLTIWEHPAPSTGMQCGVQGKLIDGRKLYRAYALAEIGDDTRRIESEIYEACDAADVDSSRMHPGSIIGEHVQVREMAQREA